MGEEAVLENVKKYGPSAGGEAMMNFEYQHGKEALETGIYVTYYNPDKKMECARVGSKSLCFCGHKYAEHNLKKMKNKNINNPCGKCACKRFRWIPQRPEECGMYWLPRRKGFKLSEWRAKCKCGHGHDCHAPNNPTKCKKCSCFDFYCDFACISCDDRWEHHETIYEYEHDRLMEKKKVGEAWLPLAMNAELQGLIFDPEKRKALPNYNRPSDGKKAIAKKPAPAKPTNPNGKFGSYNYKPLTSQEDDIPPGCGPNKPVGNDQPFPGSKAGGNNQAFPGNNGYQKWLDKLD